MRLLWIFLALAVLFLIPFLIWGGDLEALFTGPSAVDWILGWGRWAWLAGFLLLAGDLVLPIPGTLVMSAFGYVYGALAGGTLAAAGSFASGALAYGLCRLLGRGAARRLLGADGLAQGERLFSTVGGWIVALSRWMPLLPEVVACMAGLTRMPAGAFFAALACGSIPLGFTYAAIGAAGVERPGLALALSALVPPILWALLRPVFRRRPEPDQPPAT